MSKLPLPIAIVLLTLAACRGADAVTGASGAAGVNRNAQQAQPPVTLSDDGAPRVIAFDDGRTMRLNALLVQGRKAGVVAECAVRIDGGAMIVTVGEEGSETETLMCGHLREAGGLPARAGGRRVGLIYTAGTPAETFRLPVVIAEIDGRWTVDTAATAPLSEGVNTLSDLRRALGR